MVEGKKLVPITTTKGEELQKGRQYVTRVNYMFERIICDEAHTLRNPTTTLSESIRQAMHCNIHFLTATPMLNHPRDLRGYLSLIWNPRWALSGMPLGLAEMYNDGFDPARVERKKKGTEDEMETMSMMPLGEEDAAYLRAAMDRGRQLYQLDPDNYRCVGHNNHWHPNITSIMIPAIYKQLVFRLGMGTAVDLGDDYGELCVGSDVPESRIYTTQLRMDKRERKEYEDRTLHLLRQLYVGQADPKNAARGRAVNSTSSNAAGPEGIIDAGIQRFLMHATLDPRLAKLTLLNHRAMVKEGEVARDTLKRPNQWVDQDFDLGASFYFTATRDGPEYLIPADRLAMAHYCAAKSVKVRYGMYLLGKYCLEENEKVVCVFEYPMTQW
jgi:hypothetical protein